MSADGFEEALEAVFEEHAPKFSGHLREMLKQLYREGVKEGRARERESFNFDIPAPREIRGIDEFHHGTLTTAAAEDGYISLEKMQQIVKEFEESHSFSHRYDRELHGTWVDDWADETWISPNKTSLSSQRLSTPIPSRQFVIDSMTPDRSDND